MDSPSKKEMPRPLPAPWGIRELSDFPNSPLRRHETKVSANLDTVCWLSKSHPNHSPIQAELIPSGVILGKFTFKNDNALWREEEVVWLAVPRPVGVPELEPDVGLDFSVEGTTLNFLPEVFPDFLFIAQSLRPDSL